MTLIGAYLGPFRVGSDCWRVTLTMSGAVLSPESVRHPITDASIPWRKWLGRWRCAVDFGDLESAKAFFEYVKTHRDLPASLPTVAGVRKLIFDTVDDLARSLMYDGRREDEELPLGRIEQALDAREITLDEIVDRFRAQVRSKYVASKAGD